MSAARSYIPPIEIGEVMRALAGGRMIASCHRGFAPGDWVHGPFGVQEHAVSDGQNAYKIEVTGRLPAAYLGVLGLTGLTAYFGLLDVGRLSQGETVLVSGGGRGRQDGRRPDREDQERDGSPYCRRPGSGYAGYRMRRA
jgi:hypothetical protein